MLDKKTIFSLVIVFGMFVNLQAASFDCKKATTLVEHSICNDSTLSKLDEKLASTYKQSLKDTKDVDKLKQEQRDWIDYNRNLCDSVDCLKEEYTKQIAYLNTHLKPKDIHNISGYYKLGEASVSIESDLMFDFFNVAGAGANFCFIEQEQFKKVDNKFIWDDKENCKIVIEKIDNSSIRLSSTDCSYYCGMNVDVKDGVYKKINKKN